MSALATVYVRVIGSEEDAARILTIRTGRKVKKNTISRWRLGSESPKQPYLDEMRRTVVYDSFPEFADELLTVLDLHTRPVL